MVKITKYIFLIFILNIFFLNDSYSLNKIEKFNAWVKSYKKIALKKGISQSTIDLVFKDVKYLAKVIEYDRRQPEFFEDTITYVSKRATKDRSNKAQKKFIKNKNLFETVEKKFEVEKQYLLALWGIETNFGNNVGKMDIISSLSTLSFDLRRRDFFSSQLLILLELVENKKIDINNYYGSWAGAYGNFQFMPSTIKNYAIDFDKNGKIELKNSLNDSIASAANYINKIGWKSNQPCFYRVKNSKPIDNKLFNISAKKISNKLSIVKWKKMGFKNYDGTELKNHNIEAALILPDNNDNSPMYLVFNNYEKILKWNRSLRFGISVCTLADLIKDEI